jgi:hypothetical protein
MLRMIKSAKLIMEKDTGGEPTQAAGGSEPDPAGWSKIVSARDKVSCTI